MGNLGHYSRGILHIWWIFWALPLSSKSLKRDEREKKREKALLVAEKERRNFLENHLTDVFGYSFFSSHCVVAHTYSSLFHLSLFLLFRHKRNLNTLEIEGRSRLVYWFSIDSLLKWETKRTPEWSQLHLGILFYFQGSDYWLASTKSLKNGGRRVREFKGLSKFPPLIHPQVLEPLFSGVK